MFSTGEDPSTHWSAHFVRSLTSMLEFTDNCSSCFLTNEGGSALQMCTGEDVPPVATNLCRQEQSEDVSKSLDSTSPQLVDCIPNRVDHSIATDMLANDEGPLLESSEVVVLEQQDNTDTGGTTTQDLLSGDAPAAQQLAAEVRAEYALELGELTRRLKVSHANYEVVEAKYKACVNEGDQVRQQLLESKEHQKVLEVEKSQQGEALVSLQKQLEALQKENSEQKNQITLAQEKLNEEEEKTQSLSSSLMQQQNELLEFRERESMLTAQLDSAHAQLASVENEKCRLSADLEAASSQVRSAELAKMDVESALEKALQQSASCKAQEEQYVSQLKEQKAVASDLVRTNTQLADEVDALKSKIHNLERHREVSDSAFQERIMQLTQEFDAIFQEAESLKPRLAVVLDEKSGLDSALASTKKELEDTLETKHQLSDELRSAKESLQVSLEENKRFHAEIDALDVLSKEHLNENAQLKAREQELAAELVSSRQKVADCDKELCALKDSVEDLVKTREKLENENQVLRLENEEGRKHNDTALLEVNALKAEFEYLSSEKSSLYGEVQAGKEQLAELLTEWKKSEEKILELDTRLQLVDEERRKMEEVHDPLRSEVELLRMNFKAASEDADQFKNRVANVQQLNEELKEEANSLRIQLQAAKDALQVAVDANAEEHLQVEQLNHQLFVIDETVQSYAKQVADLQQEIVLLKSHISKAESTSLELAQEVRLVLPSESPEASASLKSPRSGVHLASCVRKLIHEFEARAHHDSDVQHQSLKDSTSLREREGYILGSEPEEISGSDVDALRSHLQEAQVENARLRSLLDKDDSLALSRSQEMITSLTQQLSDLRAAADKYEGQLLDQSVVERELAALRKQCEEQGHTILSYLEIFERVHGSLTKLTEKLCAETPDLEANINNGSNVHSLAVMCNDLFERVSETLSDMHQQLKHASGKNKDLEDLAESLKQEVATLRLEKASAVKLINETESEVLNLKTYVRQLETTDAESRALVSNYENDQAVARQRILSLLALFDSSTPSSAPAFDTSDLSEQETMRTLWLLNQLEVRLKARVDHATGQSEASMRMVVELQGKLDELQNLLAIRTAEVEQANEDFNILSQIVDLPSTGALDYRWEDLAASITNSAAAVSLAAKLGRLVKAICDELNVRSAERTQLKAEKEQLADLLEATNATNQNLSEQVDVLQKNEQEVRLKLELRDVDLQNACLEHRHALEAVQALQNEIEVRKGREAEAEAKLEEAVVRIRESDQEQELQKEENMKLRYDLAALQEAAVRHEEMTSAKAAVDFEVQTAVEAFLLQIVHDLFVAISSSSDAAIGIVQELVKTFSFSITASSKFSTQEIQELREKVLELAVQYTDTAKRTASQHHDEHERLESNAKMLASLEVALEAEKRKLSEAVALHNHEMEALLKQTGTMEVQVQDLKSEISSLQLEKAQGEQKLAAAKEKLALAVSKGKALSHQRDVLKQSLAAKTAELDVLATTHLEQLKEKDVALETSMKELATEVQRADNAQQEVEEFKVCLFGIEQKLLAKSTAQTELETVLAKAPLPDDLKTKEPLAQVEWIITALDKIHSQTTAEAEDRLKMKEETALLEAQLKGACEETALLEVQLGAAREEMALLESHLKEAHDRDAALTGELEAERRNSKQLAMEMERCMQSQARLSEELSHEASTKETLKTELTLTTEKLAAEVASCLKLQSDSQAMVARAQSVIPEPVRTELWGFNGSLVPSVDSVVSSLSALYSDSVAEAEKLKEMCRNLKIQVDQATKVSDEWTFLKQHVKDLEKVVAGKDHEISSLAAKMQEAAETMAHQAEEIDGTSQQMRKLKLRLDETISENATLRTQLTDVEQRLSSTREKLGMAVRKGKALKLEHDTLKHSLAEAQNMGGDYSRDLQLKESALQDLQSRLSVALEEKQALQKEKEAETTQLVNEIAGMKSVMEEATTLREYNVQQEKELESLRGSLSAMSAELRNSQSAAGRLHSDVSDLHSTNSDLRKELGALNAEMGRLRKETGDVGSLKSCLDIALGTITSLVEELEALRANYKGSTDLALDSRSSAVRRGPSSSSVEQQQSFEHTEEYTELVCQVSVDKARQYASWAQQMMSHLEQQQISKDRDVLELREEVEHLQVALQDIQTISRKVIEEKESAITQMKQKLTHLESSRKEVLTCKDLSETKIKSLEARMLEYEDEIQSLQSKFLSTKQKADEDGKVLKHTAAELATFREHVSSKNEGMRCQFWVAELTLL